MNKKQFRNFKLNLPKYPNILGMNEFFNSAVLIPLIWKNEEYQFLFEKRSVAIRQGGEICFPGGEIDTLDKNSVETAIRETEEEIGVERTKIKIVGKLDTLIGPRGITVEPIIAELELADLRECTIDETEVEKVFFVPVSYFEQNQPKIYKVISKINYRMFNENGEEESLIPVNSNDKSYSENTRKVLVYKVNGEVIWGITARLVYEVVKKISE